MGVQRRVIERGQKEMYLLDATSEVHIWEGKGVDRLKRKAARDFATERFLVGRPSWTYLETSLEDDEHLLFREKFADWPEQGAGLDRSLSVRSQQKRKAERKFDVSVLFIPGSETSNKKKADAGWFDSHQLVTMETCDDGQGELNVCLLDGID